MHASPLVLWAVSGTLCFTLTACSGGDQSSAPAPPPPSASSTKPAPSISVASLQKLSSNVTAAGIATRYDAYFDQQQLKAIVESRQGPSTGHGEYLYMGARLVEYSGNVLPDLRGGKGRIELKFDLQGRLVSARDRQNPAQTVEQAQIDALRARADLLRSHALTQRSVSAHQRTEEERG